MDNRLQPSPDSGNGDVPGKTVVRGSLTLRDYDGQGCGVRRPVRALKQNDEKQVCLESVRIA